MSDFNRFSLILDEDRFYVITLSETWLRDYKCQQNYVQINGYNVVFKNGTNKRGGAVGFYIKDQLEYKIRKDLIELRGRNKNSPTLICVAYQPSSIKAEKLEWLEKFEQLMTDIYTGMLH